MTYEARYAAGIHYALAGACILLSILGFLAAGVIPSKSTAGGGANPLVGWAIVAAAFAAAAIFVRRALDRSPQARVDGDGVWSRKLGRTVPWGEVTGFHLLRSGIQRIARFDRSGDSTFGINTTFYDRGIADLIAAVRHHRPDLAP
jgi:hypothetical protein